MNEPTEGFEPAYATGRPPWDVGVPQPAMVAATEAGAVRGRVLDAGCGTGELALYLAARGHEVVGVDASPTAVSRASAKAEARGLDAAFRVADLRSPPALGAFDTVVDSGVLHVFSDADRGRYLDSLAAALRPGGRYLALTFAPDAPDGGPRRLTETELRGAFGSDWTVERVERAGFETTWGVVPAYLTVAVRKQRGA